jgi:hypothetical protein
MLRTQGEIADVATVSDICIVGSDKNAIELIRHNNHILQFDGPAPNNFTIKRSLYRLGVVSPLFFDTIRVQTSIESMLNEDYKSLAETSEYMNDLTEQYQMLTRLVLAPYAARFKKS